MVFLRQADDREIQRERKKSCDGVFGFGKGIRSGSKGRDMEKHEEKECSGNVCENQ